MSSQAPKPGRTDHILQEDVKRHLLVKYEVQMDYDYPLANVHISMEHHHFCMEKLTISTALFDSKLFVYQRVGYVVFSFFRRRSPGMVRPFPSRSLRQIKGLLETENTWIQVVCHGYQDMLGVKLGQEDLIRSIHMS